MRKLSIGLLLVLFCSGCVTVLSPKGLTSVDDALASRQARLDFSASQPQRLQILSSIVFQYKWQRFSTLGYTDVDLDKKTFAVSCMNPVGVKLFELSGDAESIKAGFVLKELLKRGDLPGVVGEDIRRIYFDGIPLPEAAAKKERGKIIFSQDRKPGYLRYEFGTSPYLLARKSYYESRRCDWRVYYRSYRREKDKMYPEWIVMKNYRYGYKLTVRLKEVR